MYPCTLSVDTHPLAQVPDFTSTISNEVEAQSFLDASFSDLPKAPKVSSPKEREAPIGKVLLFTSKDEVPGIYKALAAQFTGKSRLLFAWTKVDTDGPAMPLMQKMNVSAAGCAWMVVISSMVLCQYAALLATGCTIARVAT